MGTLDVPKEVLVSDEDPQEEEEGGEGEEIMFILTADGDVLALLEEGVELTEDQASFLLKVSCIQEPSLVLQVVLWIEITTHKVINYITEYLDKRR
jgi:hypothetical protein